MSKMVDPRLMRAFCRRENCVNAELPLAKSWEGLGRSRTAVAVTGEVTRVMSA